MKKTGKIIVFAFLCLLCLATLITEPDMKLSGMDVILYKAYISMFLFAIIIGLGLHIKKGRNMKFWIITVSIGFILSAIPYSILSTDAKLEIKKNNEESSSNKNAEEQIQLQTKKEDELIVEEQIDHNSEDTKNQSENNEENEIKSGLTWENLFENKERYKQVLMLLGSNFREGKINDVLKNNLSADENILIGELFQYCNTHNELPKELQETFTEFCNADEYKDMFFVDDNEFYNEVSKGFEISWKSDGTYYIGLYMIPESDYAADKNYLDAERYVDIGCVLYILENGEYINYAVVEDVIYGEIIDGVCYGFGIKLDFVDKELNVEEYKDGDSFFNNVRATDGTAKYYVSVHDLNRAAKANSINYETCWNWKSLNDVGYKKNLDVYMGVGSCKRYQFTIVESMAMVDYMLVRYPNGNEEVKSYNAMVNNQALYIIDD